MSEKFRSRRIRVSGRGHQAVVEELFDEIVDSGGRYDGTSEPPQLSAEGILASAAIQVRNLVKRQRTPSFKVEPNNNINITPDPHAQTQDI